MSSVLRNPRHELYAQGRAEGLSRDAAAHKAGYKGKAVHLEASPHIKTRVAELLALSAVRSELSRRDILERIFQDWELARKLGQVPAALKAAELMGREMHKMFTERKEIGGPGDFDNKTEDELRDIIKKELTDLGWDENSIPPSAIN